MAKFKPGQSGNPAGRPVGRLSFFKIRKIIIEAFEKNEVEFTRQIEILAKKNPVKFYMTFVLALMPKDISVTYEEEPVKLGRHDAIRKAEELLKWHKETLRLEGGSMPSKEGSRPEKSTRRKRTKS